MGSNPGKPKASRVPILVIEDNADHWLIIRSALAQCFPEVEPLWMNHPSQARSYLARQAEEATRLPRLILLDLYLPTREEGLALLEFIKTHPLYRKLPVVVLSASQAREDITAVYALSVASYMTKPGSYHEWLTCFYTFRRYWWETVSLAGHIS
jgi:CheY-like chemotaxis protein